MRAAGLAACLLAPVGAPAAAASLPAGYQVPASFDVDRDLAYDWDAHQIYLPSWTNGVQTTGDPALVTWEDDGTAVLGFRGDGHEGRGGALQLVRPVKPAGRWGAVVDVTRPHAVAAFFLHAGNGKEIDFELVRRDGILGWSANVYMPKADGGRAPVDVTMPLMPYRQGPQTLEVALDDDGAVFFVDGVRQLRITPDQMPKDVIWDTETDVDLFLSIESHGPWAGQEYAGGTAEMRVLGILP